MSEKSRGAKRPQRGSARRAAGKPRDLGPMPIWDLGDLYPGPKSKAVAADLEKAATGAQRIKEIGRAHV